MLRRGLIKVGENIKNKNLNDASTILLPGVKLFFFYIKCFTLASKGEVNQLSSISSTRRQSKSAGSIFFKYMGAFTTAYSNTTANTTSCYLFTLVVVVVSSMCSPSYTVADWRKRGSQSATKRLLRPLDIHSHSYEETTDSVRGGFKLPTFQLLDLLSHSRPSGVYTLFGFELSWTNLLVFVTT